MRDIDKYGFIRATQECMKSCYNTAVSKGWWGHVGGTPLVMASKISLMHSELSELLEVVRNGDGWSEKTPEFKKSEEELADLVIRVMDFAQHYNIRLPEAIIAKMEFNKDRPYKHGGKTI